MKKVFIIIGLIMTLVFMIVLVSCHNDVESTTIDANQGATDITTEVITTTATEIITEIMTEEISTETIEETTTEQTTTEEVTIEEVTTEETTIEETTQVIKELYVSAPRTELEMGEFVILDVTNDIGDTSALYEFRSSNEKVIYVSPDGVVSAIAGGDATVIVSYGDIEVEISFHVCDAIIGTIDRPVVVKPVIYIYPEEEMDITIKYENEDKLITTYPKYNDGWNVHVKKDGTIIDENGREYYALFYDEDRTYDCPFTEGFYVYKDDAISFLEEKLDYLGFTNREADEFIMYWLPILEKNEHNFVYFELTEERNKNAPLSFSVNIDSMLRVTMHVKAINEKVDIQKQELKPFVRYGTTVVEWGGSIY